jgi:hypothetical protein
VPGYFTKGNSSSQYSSDNATHIELQNISTLSAGSHAIKFGLLARDNRNAVTTAGGFNGSFSFTSLDAYMATMNLITQGSKNGLTVAQSLAACANPGTCTPNRLNYTAGNQKFTTNVFDTALFFQDDWKVNRFFTLSSGLRWETQNNVSDHKNFGPRLAIAYALDGHKKGTLTKTVLRAGYGFFYDRFGSQMTLEQDNGGPNSQRQVTIANPTCFSEISLSKALSDPGSNCNSGMAATPKPTYWRRTITRLTANSSARASSAKSARRLP